MGNMNVIKRVGLEPESLGSKYLHSHESQLPSLVPATQLQHNLLENVGCEVEGANIYI